MKNIPPIIGIGIVAKKAPNFPKDPKIIINKALAWTTRLLPTFQQQKQEKAGKIILKK